VSTPKYTRPLDAALAQWVEALDADAREFFEERAGVIEHDGGLERDRAEKRAWNETQRYLRRRDGAPRRPQDRK